MLPYLDSWAEWLMDPPCRRKTEEGGFQHIVFNDENPQRDVGRHADDVQCCRWRRSACCSTARIMSRRRKRQFLVHIKYLVDRKTGLWFHGWTFDGRHHFADALMGARQLLGDDRDPRIHRAARSRSPATGSATFLIDTLAAQVQGARRGTRMRAASGIR